MASKLFAISRVTKTHTVYYEQRNPILIVHSSLNAWFKQHGHAWQYDSMGPKIVCNSVTEKNNRLISQSDQNAWKSNLPQLWFPLKFYKIKEKIKKNRSYYYNAVEIKLKNCIIISLWNPVYSFFNTPYIKCKVVLMNIEKVFTIP